ncbi:unnamed protein product, partial [Gordionus sp. m RMFG-2023]
IIQDYKLFIIIGVLLSIDIFILTLWSIIDPFFKKSDTLPNKMTRINSDIEELFVIEHCTSHYLNIWMAILCAYKGVLMLFGCFLAWETRHVTIPALNDSKYIGISVYNIMLLCIVGSAVSFVLKNEQSTSFLLLSIFIMLGTTITLCLVFVPKLIQLKTLYNCGGLNEKNSSDRPHFKEKDKYHDFRKRITKIVEEKHKNKRLLEEKTKNLIEIMTQLGMEVTDKESPKLSSDISSQECSSLSNILQDDLWQVQINGKKIFVQAKPSKLSSITEFTEAFELTDLK